MTRRAHTAHDRSSAATINLQGANTRFAPTGGPAADRAGGAAWLRPNVINRLTSCNGVPIIAAILSMRLDNLWLALADTCDVPRTHFGVPRLDRTRSSRARSDV